MRTRNEDTAVDDSRPPHRPDRQGRPDRPDRARRTVARRVRRALPGTALAVVLAAGVVVPGAGTRATALARDAADGITALVAGVSVVVRPGTLTTAAGAGGTVCLGVRMRDGSAVPAGAVVAVQGLPDGATATSGGEACSAGAGVAGRLLTVRPAPRTAPGRYPLTVQVTVGTRSASAPLTLMVTAPGPTGFTLEGDLVGELTPGTSAPVGLVVDNPADTAIRLTRLEVTLTGVDAAHAGACPAAANFTVQQFAGDVRTVVVPARTRVSLRDLGVAEELWPRVGMLETPDDQNGCLGAVLDLRYRGQAQTVE